MAAERFSTFVSSADLLWCFFAINEKQHDKIAALLGFEKEPEDQATKSNSESGQLLLKNDFEPYFKEPELKPTPITKDQGSSYYQVKHREKTTESNELRVENPKQDWFDKAQPTYFQETTTRVPARHRVRPDYPPLVPWSRLWPFLQRILGGDVTGTKPDMAKLVKRVSQGKMVSRIPKRSRFTWSPMACLLIDINDDNFPYRRDFIRLQQQLTDWRGEEGLKTYFIDDEPGGKIVSYCGNREIIQDWQRLAPDVPLLILSDLGMHSGSRRSLIQWLAFGQRLKALRIRATVLMPVAEREVDERLLRYFNCVIWDSTSNLKTLQGDKTASTQDQSERIENLLALCFPALRVDLGLLRSMRRLLPASEYDVGHEAAVWRHAAVIGAGDEWGWQSGVKADYQDAFIHFFKLKSPSQDENNEITLSPAKQHQFVELLGCHHAQLPDELYFEAMYELLLRDIPLPEEVRAATNDFIASLVKTVYDPESRTYGLELWVKRYVARIEGSNWLKDSEPQIALLAFDKLKHHQSDTSQIEWPASIPPEKILPWINRQQALQTYWLRQKGTQLELIREDEVRQHTDDFGTPGITLLKLALTDTFIFHCYQTVDGQNKHISFNLEQGKQARINLPPGSKQKLQVGQETITIDVESAYEKPLWVQRRGMGDNTQFIETLSSQGKLYRWYWHPPELEQTVENSDAGSVTIWQTHPGFWFYLPPNQNLKPDWADAVGRDGYGLYAEASIAGIVQRFRWIQPGSFLMGSPENENGRYDDETQHQVNLSQGYWLADTACTQALWQAVSGNNPSEFKGENHPVENVSWYDAQKFLSQLNSKQLTLALRLPTEAEWEYACRAGTTTAFNFAGELSLEKANYRGTWEFESDKWGDGALKQTAEVKRYPANAWGLYEMHGNVYEWCQDWYGDYPTETVTDPLGPKAGVSRVLRGGSWIDDGRGARSALRFHFGPDDRSHYIGFRLALGHEPSQDSADQQPAGTRATAARGAQPGDGLPGG